MKLHLPAVLRRALCSLLMTSCSFTIISGSLVVSHLVTYNLRAQEAVPANFDLDGVEGTYTFSFDGTNYGLDANGTVTSYTPGATEPNVYFQFTGTENIHGDMDVSFDSGNWGTVRLLNLSGTATSSTDGDTTYELNLSITGDAHVTLGHQEGQGLFGWNNDTVATNVKADFTLLIDTTAAESLGGITLLGESNSGTTRTIQYDGTLTVNLVQGKIGTKASQNNASLSVGSKSIDFNGSEDATAVTYNLGQVSTSADQAANDAKLILDGDVYGGLTFQSGTNHIGAFNGDIVINLMSGTFQNIYAVSNGVTAANHVGDYTVNYYGGTINGVIAKSGGSGAMTGTSTLNVYGTLSSTKITEGGFDTIHAKTATVNGVDYAGNIVIADTESWTLGADAISLTLDAGTTLTVDGTLKLTSAYTTAGTLAFGSTAQLDLSGLSYTGTNTDRVYTLFTGITLDDSFTNLDISNIIGTSTGGYTATFNSDGTVQLSTSLVTHYVTGTVNWADGEIIDDEAGAAVFSNNDFVVFDGNSTATLTEAVTSNRVTINENVEVTLAASAAGFTLTSEEIIVGGDLTLVGNVLASTSRLQSLSADDAGTVRFNIGAGNTLDYEDQIAGFTGDVVVQSGTLLFDTNATSTAQTYSLTAEAGAALTMTGVSFAAGAATITLNGGDVPALLADIDMSTAATLNINTDLKNQLTATGVASINVTDLNIIRAGIAGSGYLEKKGSDIMEILSNLTHTGTLDITEGSVYYGNGEGTTRTNSFERIILSSGGTLRFKNGATSFNIMQFNGGTFNVNDMNTGVASVARWEVTAESTVTQGLNSQFLIGELTGNDKLNFTVDSGASLFMDLEFAQIKDYNGTLDFNNNSASYELTIGTVNQSAGKKLTIIELGEAINSNAFVMLGEGEADFTGIALTAASVSLEQTGTGVLNVGAVTTSSFKQTGTGESTLSSLAINNGGSLQMTYEGTLNIAGGLTLGANTNLIYGTESKLLQIEEANIAALESLTLVLLGIDSEILKDGYSLGISTGIAKEDISALGLAVGSYELENDIDNDGYWKIILNDDAVFDIGGWDINWGINVIAVAPETLLSVADPTGSIYMSSVADYIDTVAGTTGAIFTDSAAEVALITGGKLNGGTTTTDSWIQITGGKYDTIVGGNHSAWNGGANSFIGDSHILVNQAEEGDYVQYIIGATYQDGNAPSFIGDTYISVYTDTVTGSIIGGSTNAHQNSTTFSGDSNIFIYTALTKSGDDGADAMGGNGFNLDMIIGSNSWISNSYDAQTSTHNGASNITVDLSGQTFTDATSFSKTIVGGALGHNSLDMINAGDSHVRITGTANVSFDQQIIGGSYAYGAGSNLTRTGSTYVEITANGSSFDAAGVNEGIMGADNIAANVIASISGSSNLTIYGTGSTFTDRVMGGSRLSAGSLTIHEGSHISIHGGTYSNHVIAASNQFNGTLTTGGTTLTVTAGTFNGRVVGGSVIGAGTNTNTAGTVINISGGTFTNNLHGGSIDINNAVVSSTAGLVEMNLTGGEFNSLITGGSSIGAAYTGSTTANGGVSITIDGADMNGNIIGGHIRTEGTTAATVGMGDVAINLVSGTVGMDVHAAGHLSTAFTGATTASTTVSVGSAVTFDGTNQVINGDFGGTAASSGTVTGDRKLVFGDDVAYTNVGSLSYRNFDTVEVTQAGGDVSISDVTDVTEITKTGAGTLTLGAQTNKNINLNAGTLKFSAASSLTDLHMAGGNLDVSATQLTLIGGATVSGLASSLTMEYRHATGLDLGASGTFAVEAGAKLTLNLTGLTLGGDVEQVLLSGATGTAALTGVTYRELDNGMQGFDAGDILAGLNTATDLTGYFIYHDTATDTMVLTNVMSRDLYWNAGSTDWNTSDTDWLKDDDAALATAFKNKDNVFFSKAASTISLTGDVTVNDMTAEGTDALYTFNGAQSLTVGRNLILKNGSDVTLDAATTMILTESDVSVGADSILTLNQTGDLTMKSLTGAGTVSASGNVTITELVTAGGTLTATGKTVTLADGENVFASLTAGTVAADHIKIGGGTIGLFDGTQVAITGGDVTITLLGQNLESFSNAGTFTTTGDLTINSAVSTGGTVSAAAVTLAGTSNSFTQLTAADVVQDADATLSLGGTSRITSLNEGALEIDSGGTVQITTTTATSLVGVTGGGGLTTGGDLSLTGTDASKVGALTVAGELTTKAVLNATSLKANNLVLGADLILTGSLDASSLDEINVNHSLATTPVTTPSESAPVIKASGINLGGATEINFTMTNENLLSAGLANGESYVLAELTTDTGIVGNMLKINDGLNWMIETSKFTIVKDGNNIVLTMTREGNTWEVAGGSGLWSDGDAWSGGFSPTNPTGAPSEAILAGTLPSTGIEITLGADALASSVVVETDTEGMQYTLKDGNLSTPSLQVNKGVLSLESATVVLTTGATIDSQLVLGANGKLMLDADSSLTAKRLDFNAGATLENAGSLSIDSFDAATAIITNTGTLTLGDGSALATVIGATGSLATQDGAQVSIGALQNSGLDLGVGSTLSVDAAMTLSTMTGTGLLTIGTGSDDQGLTVATDSTGIASGGLQADSLTLQSGSQATFTQLAVNSITIEGDLSTTETRLSAGSLSDYAGTGGKIDLDISADTIDALMTGSGGVAQSYNVYEQAGITWDDFAISEATKQAVNTHIIAEGNDILLTKQGDTLTFTMQESTDRLWKTSDNFALTAGSAGADISVLKPIYDDTTDKMVNYDILNTVDRVYVNEDFTIDLVGVDAVSILPDTPTLHIQNLAGDAGKTLTIIGDGATEDNVSLRNTQTSYALNDLVAKNVTVNTQAFGLGVVLELASVSLEDAVLDVLPYRIRAAADAETGTTVGSLSNKEGDSSLVRGTLSINGAGGVYTGSYEGAEINALAGADQVLQAGDGLTIMGDAGHLYITEAAGGQMDGIKTTGADVTLDMRNAAATQSLTLANGSIMDGGTLTILLNDKNVEAGETQQVVNETGGSLTLNPDTNLMLKVDVDDGLLTLAPGSGAGVELVEISEGLNLTGNQIDLGSTLSKYFADLTYDPTTGIISAQINTDYYATFAQSANGLAGLEMMTDVMINLNPLGNTGKYPELAEVMTALDDLLAKDPVAADHLAASIAGAGNLGLGMAVSGDMARQLGSIRNRTMSMGTDPSAGASGEWGFNGWINAETSSTDLSGSGTTAGYKLSSWGGTVGAEANVNERFTFGLALSSMYGDYSSNDVDTHTGEVNTNYLSAFARLHDGRWSHSFVISGGLSELSTSRTVSYAGGSYDTSGDTEGSSFGMLYELAYTYAMNEESSTAWQPLVSVAFQTSSVDAYTETGSDAALSVGEQNVAYATLGLGARMETVVGENIYNRSSVLSLRAMAKADFGDDSSEASVSMARGTESSTVTSAERGMYGLEVGAGLVVPIMSGTSSLFFDANFEVRENQNSFSATAGYRFSF